MPPRPPLSRRERLTEANFVAVSWVVVAVAHVIAFAVALGDLVTGTGRPRRRR
ncbi:hypothetical protein ACRQ4B_06555 [Curtobacterium sp. SP.BCo]|uniref:hypothetical protein n=1 Tax=Curtobacterium sp. SP.BCo TaxID=3435229 RepID=UPI003F73BD0A